jgi:hypothetical protein
MNTKQETAYIAAYDRAIAALEAITNDIHDGPAPDGQVAITWANVADMARFARQLEEICGTERGDCD